MRRYLCKSNTNHNPTVYYNMGYHTYVREVGIMVCTCVCEVGIMVCTCVREVGIMVCTCVREVGIMVCTCVRTYMYT